MSRMLPGIPRAAVLAAFPVLLTQGLRVRRTTQRLPEAEGLTGESGLGEGAARVVVLGDSVAAGVGLDHHRDALAGRLAGLLAERWQRPVAWSVVARSGLTARGVTELVADARAVEAQLADADLVVVSVGVNDTKNLHGDAQWRTELGQLLDQVVAVAPGAQVVLLGIPPMEVFPALPAPLSLLMGARARRMDRIGREVVAARPGVRRVELVGALGVETAFASDGFHPSAQVHAHLAQRVLAVLSE